MNIGGLKEGEPIHIAAGEEVNTAAAGDGDPLEVGGCGLNGVVTGVFPNANAVAFEVPLVTPGGLNVVEQYYAIVRN